MQHLTFSIIISVNFQGLYLALYESGNAFQIKVEKLMKSNNIGEGYMEISKY